MSPHYDASRASDNENEDILNNGYEEDNLDEEAEVDQDEEDGVDQEEDCEIEIIFENLVGN